MSNKKLYKTGKCPVCSGLTYSNIIDVGEGYYYEPLHCSCCSWCEKCSNEDEENCKQCSMYRKCFSIDYRKELEKHIHEQECKACGSKDIGIDNWDMFEGENDWFYYCKQCDNTFVKK